MKYSEKAKPKSQKQISGCQGVGGAGVDTDYNRYGASFGDDKNVLEQMGGDSCTIYKNSQTS